MKRRIGPTSDTRAGHPPCRRIGRVRNMSVGALVIGGIMLALRGAFGEIFGGLFDG